MTKDDFLPRLQGVEAIFGQLEHHDAFTGEELAECLREYMRKVDYMAEVLHSNYQHLEREGIFLDELKQAVGMTGRQA